MTDSLVNLDRPTLEWMLDPGQPMLTMIRTGLAGLSDEEYLWEPVEGCWSVRPRAEQLTGPDEHRPEGDWGLDIEYPDPAPAPFTTIAWRLVHMIGSVYVAASALRGRHNDDGTLDTDWSQDRSVPATATAAVARWQDAIETLWGLVAAASA
jgi:DinB superfamily